MCGITGIFDTQGTRPLPRQVLMAMNASQWHRGPDEGSVHLEPGVGLGHRRLSVIDVASGQQPLFNEDGSVVVVFNGEIYNFRELRTELQGMGHRFRTRSDTEVIVHAWEAWGESCVERFRGMFAFGLWDRNQRIFFLARDRLGVKPLFYGFTPDGLLLFGSELKSLLAYSPLQGAAGPGIAKTIDPFAVEEYFALGYVAEPRTIYKGARKLEPGHTLTLRRGLPVPLPKPYWDVHFSLHAELSSEEAQAEFRERLQESVRLRMVADVPLGAFLSGGVDSSAVVAAMSRVSDQPVLTCSIGFEDPAFNETEFAAQVDERYRTRHQVETVGTEDFGLIDTLAYLYDEPFADSSAIPTFRVCQLARRQVTVALSGDGADETFGGYRRYRMHLMEERMRSSLPLGLRQPVFGLLGRWYPKADWAPRPFRAKTTFESLARTAVQGYFNSMSLTRQPLRNRLFSARLHRDLAGYTAQVVFDRHAAKAGTHDPLALIQYIDLKTYLVGDINTKVDRASMAHSLEVREPLMDHTLVEWAATLPSRLKMQGGEGKFFMKRALEPWLPQDVLYRPKMGFAVPLARWFRGPLQDRLQGLLRDGPLGDCGFLNMDTVHDLVRSHTSGRQDHSQSLWQLVMFDAFLRRAEDSAPAVPSGLAAIARQVRTGEEPLAGTPVPQASTPAPLDVAHPRSLETLEA